MVWETFFNIWKRFNFVLNITYFWFFYLAVRESGLFLRAFCVSIRMNIWSNFGNIPSTLEKNYSLAYLLYNYQFILINSLFRSCLPLSEIKGQEGGSGEIERLLLFLPISPLICKVSFHKFFSIVIQQYKFILRNIFVI